MSKRSRLLSALGRREGYYVVVSGAPSSGKTTLAVPLACELGLPLISLDAIKESLADTLEPGDEDWSNRLGAAAFDALLAIAADTPVAVLEAWWRSDRADRLLQLGKPIIELFCHCPGAELEARARRRVVEGRHIIHRDVLNPEIIDGLAEFSETIRPIGHGHVLVVETITPPDISQVAQWVRTCASNLEVG